MARLVSTKISNLHSQLTSLNLRLERLKETVKLNEFQITEIEQIEFEIKRIKTMLILRGEPI